MTNNQKPEQQVSGGMFLEVNEMFTSIQGEGPFSGTSATFIRLAGCNLQCTWCDTEYTSRDTHSIESIVNYCETQSNDLIVITGGEPMRQEIAPLIHLLEQEDFTVQIETNGILWSSGVEMTGCTIVCSPKTNKVHPNIYILKKTTGRIYIKLVIGESCYPSQPDSKGGHVFPCHDADYIIPLDTGDVILNKVNYRRALDYVWLYQDSVLQLQIHKILGLR